MLGQNFLQRQLIKYRDLLANISRRNRELYFREIKGSSVNLSKSSFAPSDYKNSSKIIFVPVVIRNGVLDDFLTKKEINLNSFFHFDDVEDQNLVKKQIKKLEKIRLADERYQKEFGVSGAWLLGPFLCWRNTPQFSRADMLISPILKVPVDIKKNKQRLYLTPEDEQLKISPTLSIVLKNSTGIVIPEDESFDSAKEAVDYLCKILLAEGKIVSFEGDDRDTTPAIPSRINIIKDENGDEIERKNVEIEEVLNPKDVALYDKVTFKDYTIIDVIYLDQLNASRAVLINDYETIIDKADQHPILNELFNRTHIASENKADRGELAKLDEYKENSNYFVVDIDSTQHRAIEKATTSKAIVIQGPPGTGKSQTITNLIADYVAKGKRVLFVSEKRPALDVVHTRLKLANIDAQSVLIHSSELKKSELYKSFLQLAATEHNSEDEEDWEKTAKSLDNIKLQLNTYANALKKHHSISKLSAADILFLSTRVDEKYYDPKIGETFGQLDSKLLNETIEEIEKLREAVSRLNHYRSSIWYKKKNSVLKTISLIHELKGIRQAIDSIKIEDQTVKREIENLINLQNTQEYFEKISLFMYKHKADFSLMQNYASLWQKMSEKPEDYLNDLVTKVSAKLHELEKESPVLSKIRPHSNLDHVAVLESYYGIKRNLKDRFTKKYWLLRRLRKEICPIWDGGSNLFKSYREYHKHLGILCRYANFIVQDLDLLAYDFDRVKQWCLSNIEDIKRIENYFKDARENLPASFFSKTYRSFEDNQKLLSELEALCQLFVKRQHLKSQYQQKFGELNKYFIEPLQLPDNLSNALVFIDELVNKLDDIDILDEIDKYFETAKKVSGIVSLKDIVDCCLKDSEKDWRKIIESSVYNTWYEQVIVQSPELRNYNNSQILANIDKFKLNEKCHQTAARNAVNLSFAQRWNSSGDKSGLSILTLESQKQRRVLAPREIMERGALNTMMQLKPVWLMSPLSISQMLPLTSCLFDVIIFDEASQVRVEDAIPSIFRASTMVVVGDDKQMPPTNFFSGVAANDDDEDDYDDDIGIADSVLDLAIKAYPSVILEWHYRSRSEALIAFSNRAFYGGQLIAPPNPFSITKNKSVNFYQINQAYFTSREGNQVEAQFVIDTLTALLMQKPNKSFGVIAFGQSQAVALETALDKKMEDDPDARYILQQSMNYKDGDAEAGLFIKNLENVQGDERDVILISVGYAPVAPDKKLKMNFGPISKQGGGRRLNVAITRAKEEIHVFTSFSPSEIPTTGEAFGHNPNLCTFGRYLKYAESISNDDVDSALAILNTFPMGGIISKRKSSRFALNVQQRLEERGYQVTAEIGSSGFYIDLGIHHPNDPGNYLVGIECDGAIFHSTPYARDRDKIREKMLKDRGWKILRIWSQDWSKNWQIEIERIDEAIKNILKS